MCQVWERIKSRYWFGGNWIATAFVLASLVGLLVMWRGCVRVERIEDAVYLWTRGEVYCGECRRHESIKRVFVRDEEREGGERVRYVYITTDKHDGEDRAFEARAKVRGDRITQMRVSDAPGWRHEP